MVLVHICCSVDSHYFLEKLQEDYPQERIIGFFYDPNIHPYSEYKLRLLDVQFSCDKLGIDLIEGPYDLENWLKITKGLENEPEKGDRCSVCFDNRLDVTLNKAKELGCDKFTTTLLISPKKSQDKLQIIGEKLALQSGIEFIFKDYRSGDGVQIQGQKVKENKLYRQNYCGCLYALSAQREYQDRLKDELISPIGQDILPNSIEYRLKLYKNRDKNPDLDIVKNRFLNYRLLSGKVIIQKKIIDSYFLPYSTLKNNKTQGRVERVIDNIGYFNRDELKMITLEFFNSLANSQYKNIKELVYSPLEFERLLNIRSKLLDNSFYDLSCVVVVDKIEDKKYEIICNSVVYDDTIEKILK